MAKHSSHILELARKGAEHRYAELKEELASLVRDFPHLSGKKRGIVDASKGVKAPRKRRRMSAAAKKAVSVRMKKYWAARRKAE